jgi:group I intron endonuclease
MAYLYRHIRLDKNEVFYIGIGTDDDGKHKRAYDKKQRNRMWNSIIKKTDYEVEIMLDDVPNKIIYEKEKEFIAIYGRRDNSSGTLCNMTDGGEGCLGFNHTEETRKRISESKKGIKNPAFGLHRKNKKTSEETKMKIREAHRGKFVGELNPYYGKKHSDEIRKKMSEIQKKIAKRGDKNPMSVKVINTKTKEIFNSIREAAEKSGYTYNQVKSIFNGNTKHNYTNLIRLSEYNKKEGFPPLS